MVGGDADEVTRSALEVELDALRANCARPEHGLFGPDSWSWRVGRELVNLLGGGRAALLQMAHPWVARAIADHSVAHADLSGRFYRTFFALHRMMFGPLDEALDAARRVHRVHAGVRGRFDVAAGSWSAGQPYAANVEDALMWVHATLIDTSFLVYDLCVAERTRAETRAHYQESRRFGRLFGLTDRVMPPDYEAFRGYWDETLASGVLEVTPAALALAPTLLAPGGGWKAPLWEAHAAVTARLLPPGVREAYGLRLGLRERALARATLASARRLLPILPRRLRFVPAWHDAQRRIAGAASPDRVAHALWRRGVATLLGAAVAQDPFRSENGKWEEPTPSARRV